MESLTQTVPTAFEVLGSELRENGWELAVEVVRPLAKVMPPTVVLSEKLTVCEVESALPPVSTTLNTTCEVSCRPAPPVPFSVMLVGVEMLEASLEVGANVSISVVVASYNHAAFLHESIDSALGQTLAPIEVIVVDDGSTDGSQEIVRGYGDRIVPILLENRGTAAALNAGVSTFLPKDVDPGELVARLHELSVVTVSQ